MLTTKSIVMANKKVSPRDFITVYGTGKSRFLAKGKEEKVHRVAGEKLIEQGKAAKTKAEAESFKLKEPEAPKK
jgi:hypothetical protein